MGHRVSIICIAMTLLLPATASFAQGQMQQRGAQQPPQQAAKPYKAVAISAPAAVKDPSFEAFRQQLANVAQKKDRKALAGIVAQNFFWMIEDGDRADKRRSGIDNLAKAIELDGKDGQGWETLLGYSDDPTGTPYPDRKDTICAPADPVFNQQELDALFKATGTDDGDWGYPTQPGIEVRAQPQPNAPVVEKLGMHFVRIMQQDGPGNQQSPMVRVVAPSGKTGYVPIDALSPLGNDQICYSKEGGTWKIAGVIGGDQ